MRLPTRFIMFIGICLVFVPGWVQGQESEVDSNTVIYLHNMSDEDNTRLITSIRESLADYNISVYVIGHMHYPLQYGIQQWIQIWTADVIMSLDARSSIEYQLPISPILYVNSTLPTCCQIGSNEMQRFHYRRDTSQTLVSLITALGLYQSGYYVEAIEQFTTTEELMSTDFMLNPDEYNQFMQFYIANSWLMLGEYDDAIENFEALLEGSPDHIPSIINLIWIYLQTNHLDEASGLLNDLTEYHDELYETVTGAYTASYLLDQLPRRAQIYALAFDYDSAIADMDEAITIAEENELDNLTLARLYTTRGEIIFLIYEWDRVEDNFNTAIELDPTYAPAYFERGVLFYTMARREDAMADFETYLELEPDGIHAEDAQSYIDSIEIELEALNG